MPAEYVRQLAAAALSVAAAAWPARTASSLATTLSARPAGIGVPGCQCSHAAVEKLKQDAGAEAVDAATCAMGLSLGEYSALCFAGALSFADGVKITKARGEAMQAASDAVDTGMVSVIGLTSDKVEELCDVASEKSGAKVQIANFLCKGNYAVSGATEACDYLAEIAKPEFKARMTVKLAVAGAFHTGKKINRVSKFFSFSALFATKSTFCGT